MELYRRYISQLFEKLVTCRRFAQIRIPTEANAAESGLDPQDYIRRMDRAYDVDYDAVRAACEHAAAQFAGASRVAVRTGEGCVLQLELTGRTWLTDAGDGDLPCGEIYIAPVEAKTNGDVFFGTLYLEGEAYTDVTLQITNGEITGSSCEAVAAHFAGLPRENRIVCELGLGMNPNVTDLCGYTLLDEKWRGHFILPSARIRCSAAKTGRRTMSTSSAAEKWRCWHETRRATGASNRNKNPCPVRAPGRGSL